MRVREGRFQRWLALAAGLSSALSGLEVGYLHYRGSYSRRVMYTPVILSAALLGAGVWAFRSRQVAKTVLPAVSALTLVDCAIGTYFHIRGIQRKPGGWRLPMTNIVMGPPVFGPLLFGTSAYLGMIASFLRREDGSGEAGFPRPAHAKHWAATPHGSARQHWLGTGPARRPISKAHGDCDRDLGFLQRVRGLLLPLQK